MNDALAADALPEPTLPFFRSVARWCVEGMRTSIFLKPRWEGLAIGAGMIAFTVVLYLLANLLFERLYIVGPASFHWKAINSGWIHTALAAWICYLVRGARAGEAHANAAPSTAHLFTMSLAQTLCLSVLIGCIFVVLVRTDAYAAADRQAWLAWFLWLAPVVWMTLAQLALFWRGGNRKPGAMLLALLVLAMGTTLLVTASPARFWHPVAENNGEEERKYLELTQEVMEAQPRLLASRLNDLKPHEPGRTEMYALTFAPYDEDVFPRESEMVAQVMASRFGTQGRTLQLINSAGTVEKWPWATPLNLRRALERVAQLMDTEEDILFLHMTSHGAQDGELAASFWPMEVSKVRPEDLRKWLDEAGIRNRVISISACYSGSWVKPLADDHTLVLTAADAEHTSYGCGSKSELTFFGRALYDEQLRTHTLSFEEAFRAARKVIEQREKEAGKDDGFSNPQIHMGAAITQRLAALQDSLARRREK
ncbi:MAG: hypothetical protein K0S28_1318 [Paucimonas sp.]|jgi:hypothetical protein|nr:hypothetical protein [Paucimonas sp.]